MIRKELEGLALHKGAEQLVFLVVAVVKSSTKYRAMQAFSQVFFSGRVPSNKELDKTCTRATSVKGDVGACSHGKFYQWQEVKWWKIGILLFLTKNIILILQFGLSKSNLEPLKIIKNETNIMCYFLQWAGLRAAIPQMLN